MEQLILFEFVDTDTNFTETVCETNFFKGLQFFRKLQRQAGQEPAQNYSCKVINKF